MPSGGAESPVASLYGLRGSRGGYPAVFDQGERKEGGRGMPRGFDPAERGVQNPRHMTTRGDGACLCKMKAWREPATLATSNIENWISNIDASFQEQLFFLCVL
jgi:hypothetical protein